MNELKKVVSNNKPCLYKVLFDDYRTIRIKAKVYGETLTIKVEHMNWLNNTLNESVADFTRKDVEALLALFD